MSPTERPAAPGGFTLLEVLVAMILLAVGVLGLQALSVTAIRSTGQARLQTSLSTSLAGTMESNLYRLRYATAAGAITPGTSCTTGELGETCTTISEVASLSSGTQKVFSVNSVLKPVREHAPITMSSVIYVPIASGGGTGQ